MRAMYPAVVTCSHRRREALPRCWVVNPDEPPYAFAFPDVPGPHKVYDERGAGARHTVWPSERNQTCALSRLVLARRRGVHCGRVFRR